MDFNLSEDHRLMLESVKRFANQIVRPAAQDIDLKGQIEDKIFKGATELGLPLDAVPAAHGGYLEGPFSHLGRVLRDEYVANACAGCAHQLESIVDVALAIGKGEPGVQAKWFAEITGHSYATAAVLGERDEFTAKRSGKDWLISGAQTAVLLAESAAFWLIRAKGPDGVLLALSAGKQPGADTFRISNTGWRACDAADVHLTEMKVAGEDILAAGDAADALWQSVLDSLRVSVSARAVGVAQAALDFAQQYAGERVQFGRPIAKFQAVAQMIEESQAAVAAARLLVRQTAFRLDAGERISADIQRVKAHTVKVLTRATIDAVQVLGGYGFVNDYPVERNYRDARVFETFMGRDMLDVLLAIQAA